MKVGFSRSSALWDEEEKDAIQVDHQKSTVRRAVRLSDEWGVVVKKRARRAEVTDCLFVFERRESGNLCDGQ